MITEKSLKELERYLDSVWKLLGIDIDFTRHFMDRVNDERNRKQIEIPEIRKLFVDAFKKHGKTFAKIGNRHKDIEGVLSDLSTKINTPFVLKWDNNNKEFDLVGKTVMRKKNFRPNNNKEKKYTVEDNNMPNLARKFGFSQDFVGLIDNKVKDNRHDTIKQTFLESLKNFKDVASRMEITDPKFQRARSNLVESLRMVSEEYWDEMEGLINEGKELLGELSKKTLGSYVKKAASSEFRTGLDFKNAKNDDDWKKGIAIKKRSEKRNKGIEMAVDKLSKEDIEFANSLDEYELNSLKEFIKTGQLDELSKKTLGNYVKNASKRRFNAGLRIGVGTEKNKKKLAKQDANRDRGIQTAVDKLTKK